MKYIKIIIFIYLAFTFYSGKLNGQNSVGDTTASGLDQQNKQSVKDSVKTVHVPFSQIDEKDKPGGIGVLDPDEIIKTDNNFTLYDISTRLGGLLWYNNIWGLGDALIMIDGVPRNIGDIRIEEVEQVTVLKGSNAVSLYGSHAANGVVLITTKRGTSLGKKINIKVNSGLAVPKLFPKYLNSADYMTLYNEARFNDGLEVSFDPMDIENYKGVNTYRYPDLDYYSSDYLKSYVQKTDVFADFSTGNSIAKFYFCAGWSGNSTLLNIGEGTNEKDNRFNVRGNVDIRINDFITSNVDISTDIFNSRRGLGNYWSSANSIQPNKYAPLVPINLINPDSTKALLLAKSSNNIIDNEKILGGSREYLTNPIADLLVGGYNTYVSRILQITNGINFDLTGILNGLSFHTLFSADYYNSYNQSINNQYAVYSSVWDSVPGSNQIVTLEKFGADARTGTQNVSGTNQTRNIGSSAYFKYSQTFDEVHNFSGLFVASGNFKSLNGVYQPKTNSNMGLQLAYNFKHKYWLDISSAFVNSTKLPDNQRTALSPTLSVSWLLSQEPFFSGIKSFDYLKLNLSTGIVNTDNTINDYYLYDNTYTPQAWFGWQDGLYNNQAATSLEGANPDFSFSKRKEVSAAIEGSVFDKLLRFESSFFITRMDGLPTQRFTQYPSYYTNFVPYTNYNSNQYSGIDFMLEFNKKAGELEFSLGLNGIYVNTKVIKKDELFMNDYQKREGKQVDAIFGLVSSGLFMDKPDIENSPKQAFGEVQPGDIKYVDQNGDGIIDANDEVKIGRWISPFSFALNFSVSYKNINLFLQGTGSMGGNGIKSDNYYWVDGDDKYSAEVLNRWTEATKTSATFPRLSSQSNSNNFRFSDFWIYNATRFNISRIQLTYDVPAKFVGHSFVKGLGVYLNTSNLLTISKNKDIMDLNTSGSPQMRYFNAGIRATF